MFRTLFDGSRSFRRSRPTSHRHRATRETIHHLRTFERLEDRTLLSAVAGGTQRALALPRTSVPGELLVSFRADVTPQQISKFNKDNGLIEKSSLVTSLEGRRAGLKLLSTSLNVNDSLIARLRKDPRVEYAEPNYMVTAASLTPTDPQFGQLWGLNNTGQSGGKNDADIDAPEAWDYTTGSPNVIVGVIDTGVDYNHPELVANIWNNPGECLGAGGACVADGVDNDGNGYVDDFHGINAITNSGNPMDDNGHGTHVSGTIGAVGWNEGVVGVNHRVSIVACKFLDSSGSGSTADAVKCFQYLNRLKKVQGQNIVVTNNSWGGGGFSQALLDAMAAKDQPGMAPILHAVAAGNGNSNNDTTANYPANNDLPNIVSVAATDRNDLYASFSNFGKNTVDLAAPGVSILSTTPGNTFSVYSGTSMATPHVAGAAALISSAFPLKSAAEIKDAILASGDPIGTIGNNAAKPTLTDRRLNVYNALISLGAPANQEAIAPSAVSDLSVVKPGLRSVTLAWTATGDDYGTGTASFYDVRYASSQIDATSWDNATRALGESGPKETGQPETFKVTGLNQGTTYFFALKVRDERGNESGLSNVVAATTPFGESVFSDDFENGLTKWTAQSPWGVSTTYSHSPTRSATDSPSGNYGNFANTSLTSTTINLSSRKDAYLSFWQRYNLEAGYDFGRLEVSGNGGASWSGLTSFTGVQSSWQNVVYDLSAYDGNPSVKIRFRLTSDFAVRADGWYVDDVEIVAQAIPGIKVSPLSGLITTEAGGTGTFTVVLNTQPSEDVEIGLSSGDPTEGTVSPSKLTFTSTNWQSPQTVTVAGVDDGDLDGDVTYTIITASAISLDSDYSGLNPSDVSVTNRDDEVPPTKFYVVNDGSTDRTYEYTAAGAAIENYSLTNGNTAPRGVATTSVGDRVWVVDNNKNVYVYNSSGGQLGVWTAGGMLSNALPEGIATDGTHVWIVDRPNRKVYRYENAANLLSGSPNANPNPISLNSNNTNAKDIVTDGTSLWVVDDASTNRVYKYTVGGTFLGRWTIDPANATPTGITIDPSNVSDVWIVDSGSDRVYRYAAAASRTSGNQSAAGSFALAANNTNPQGIADPPVPGSEPALELLHTKSLALPQAETTVRESAVTDRASIPRNAWQPSAVDRGPSPAQRVVAQDTVVRAAAFRTARSLATPDARVAFPQRPGSTFAAPRDEVFAELDAGVLDDGLLSDLAAARTSVQDL